jgi:hypothetical protein
MNIHEYQEYEQVAYSNSQYSPRIYSYSGIIHIIRIIRFCFGALGISLGSEVLVT